MPSRRKLVILGALGAALAVLWWLAPMVAALAFVLDVAGLDPPWRRLIPIGSHAYETTLATVTTRHGPVTVRVYRPVTAAHTAVVFPGVHGGGVDEPRLARFCGRLAATGTAVICAPLPELREFRITPHSTDQVEDIVLWASDAVASHTHGSLAVVGVSFGGGLALVAAGRPSLRDRVGLVVAIGGYGDLPRTLRYLCTGVLPDGTVRPPHDYGLAVVAYDAAAHLVPADQVAGLEHGIRTFLEGSLDDRPGQPVGGPLFAAARAEAAALPEPARSILTWVTERDTRQLGERLLPLIDLVAGDPALSPERSPATHAPVFLLHSDDDNVIPSSETTLVADYLEDQGAPDVHRLLTPLMTHAALRPTTSFGDAWRLVRFWQGALAALP